MRKVFSVLFILFVSAFHLTAQNYGPWNGTLVLNDDTELPCTFTINPFGSDEVFIVKTDTTLFEYKISEIKSYSYFDTVSQMMKYFKKFVLRLNDKGYYERRFFEEIHRTNDISILSGWDIRVKIHLDRFNQPVGRTRIKEKNPKYLLDNAASVAYPFTESELKRLTRSKMNEVKYFVKRKHIKLWRKNLSDYIAVVDYYSALQAANSRQP